MSATPQVDAYLDALGAALAPGLPRGARRRVIDEASDHLRCRVEARLAEGCPVDRAEHEAVERFGTVEEVAATHVRPVAARAASRVGPAAVALASVFVALMVVTTQVASVRVGAPAAATAGGIAGVVGWIGVQVAFVAAGLTVLRWLRLRRLAEPVAGDLRLLVHGAVVVVGTTAVSLACDVDAFRRMPAGQGQHAALVFGLVSLGMVVTAVVTVQAGSARRRVAGLSRLVDEPATLGGLGELLVAGVAAMGPAARSIGHGGALSLTGRHARSVVVRVRMWPVRAAAVASVVVGLAAGLAHLVAEGAATDGPARTLLALVAIGAIEGGLVLTRFLALGRYLGLRPTSVGRAPVS